MPYPGIAFVASLVTLIGFRMIWGNESKVYFWAFLALGNIMAASLATIIGKSGCLL